MVFGAAQGGGSLGWTLVVIGLMIAAVGLFLALAPPGFRLGRLPGDVIIEGRNGRFYFPVTTCVIISILLSLVMWIFRASGR